MVEDSAHPVVLESVPCPAVKISMAYCFPLCIAAVCLAAAIAAGLLLYMRRRDAAAKEAFINNKTDTAQVTEVICKNPDDDLQGPPSSATAR